MFIREVDRVVVIFSDAWAAACLVAGVPAAARTLREIAGAGASRAAIAVPGGWQPVPRVRAELDRLAQGMPFAIVDTAALAADDAPQLLVQGEHAPGAERLRAALAGEAAPHSALFVAAPRDWNRLPRLTREQAAARLDRAGRAIIAATSKPGDGIVSQVINRPISQAITRALLRLPGITPLHATAVSALLAVAMIGALVFGGVPGLVAGGILFQLASIVDGVDGEIARATFRTSKAGAMADSLVDATTNVGFLAALDLNLWIQGNARVAIAGLGGLAMMALGLFLIGRRARNSDNAFTFDGVKTHFQNRKSWSMQMLIWLTMRDFFAIAWLVGIVAGVAAPGLVLFSFGAAMWLVVVLFVFRRQAT